jgi:hypothetical protein
VAGAQAVLAKNFAAADLQGSSAMGDWDSHNDVDFIIAIRREMTARYWFRKRYCTTLAIGTL